MNGAFIANFSADGNFIFQGIVGNVNNNNNQIIVGNPDEQVQRNSFARQSLSDDVAAARRRIPDVSHAAAVRATETVEDPEDRRILNAAQMRLSRAIRSPNEAAERRCANASRMKHSRARELPYQTAERRCANAAQMAHSLTRELPHQAAERRCANAAQMAHSRARELPHQAAERRCANAARMAHSRAMRSPNEAAERRRANAAQVAHSRARELPHQAAERRCANAARMERLRALEQPEQAPLVHHNELDRAVRLQGLHNIARNYNTSAFYSLGAMDGLCQHCSSLQFSGEKFLCCHNGKVTLPELSEYPQELYQLITGNSVFSQNFLSNIRQYNSSNAFASMGANLRPPPGRGPPCFRISGQIFHRSGCLYPPDNVEPSFNQLFILETADAVNIRMNNPANNNCLEELFVLINNVLERTSPFFMAYKNMHEIELEQHRLANQENRAMSVVTMHFRSGPDRRRYNNPSADEVAAVFVGEDGAPPGNRDIIVYPRDHPLQQISTLSANLDPMVYPLFFPRGDPGWHINLLHNEQFRTAIRRNVTLLQYYVYRLSVRDAFSPLFLGKKLFQQFIVDAYVKVEGQRLSFIRNNQRQLRVESYQGLLDHLNVQADQQNLNPGRIVILPSSFQGSPRAMRQNYMDAMAIVCKYGKPDLFLTFTCNPRWPEIVDNLFPGQTASDRPDLVSRVFNMKVKMLMDDIHKRFVLGKTVANVYVIEFQKRGLPHVHMLIHLDEADKLRDADDIDSLISAEIPDPDEHPALYETVKSCMVHGPCGALNPSSVCMAEGKCTKEFPKPYKETTANNVNGYPQYRRRENGRTVNVRGVDLDNRWIVPYNSYLSSKYNAHINLEACMTVHAVKYLYKYLYKGHDCATVEINERLDHDEVKTFVDARYVSAPEASWRLFSFKLHDKSHVIFRLAVHLPAQEMVYFHEGEEQAAAERAENRHTHLTAWFKLNRENPDANQYLYQEIPHHFTFDQNRKEWKVRRRNSNKIISRMYASHPKENERFFLRMLLLHVPGATSFQHLQTYNGEVYPTFREACIARGFLESDEEWERTLQEVSAIGSPKQLRQTFSFLLTHAEVNNPSELWRNHRHGMIEDFLRTMSEANAEISALTFIAGIIRQSGKKLTDFNLPDIDQVPEEPELNILEMAQEVDEIRPTLNQDQSNVAENVISSVTNVHNGDIQNNRVFFLDAPGGTGKTYTINYIIKVLQSRGMKVATCAWTGIAATLLEKGLTVHSLFRLPVPIIETSTCNIPPTSDKAAFLMEQDLIVCDEVSMVPKHALEAIDKALRDIANNDSLFGGKVFLLSGDFRQILPVVRRARPAEIIEVCLKSSYIWNYIQVYNLRLNMRANENQQVFIQWLLNLGNGQILLKDAEPFKDCIELPQTCILPQNASLIDAIFLDNENDLSSRVILSTTNDDALKMNNDILGKLPGDSVNYLSADSIVTDDVEERALYPQEFLNSITPSGMPPHCLKLKVNCIVMLLRNLDLKAGLCNGTRLIVRGLRENVIDAEIITGIAVGTRVLIPKIALSPSDTGLPFQLRRRQFPLRLSYCMTINKAQGQTFKKVGIFLRRPCFSHGQLYVAFSRARSFDDIMVKIVQNESQGSVRNKHYTKNVVYPQVL